MFTGIVQRLAEVRSVERAPALLRIVVDLDDLAEGLTPGASVAVNGVCLTVTGVAAGGAVHFDIIQETLDRTSLGGLMSGQRVNVERSFRIGDEVGGHIVSGHVAGVGSVAAIEQAENLRVVHLQVPPELGKYLFLKGFVALDGASLTISHWRPEACRLGVSLIPETIERTTLGRVEVGDRVNIEIDAQTQAVVETVERVLAERAAQSAAT